MQVLFRQGLIGYQPLPKYFQLHNSSVSLNADIKPIQIAFAHDVANYLFVEKVSIVDAWQGLNLMDSFWLYWDIDLITANRTFGFTQLPPGFGPNFPTSPEIDQHFFNQTKSKMYFFNGDTWIECIRVFAGSLIAGALTIMPQGTQVNINTPIDIGAILHDVYGKPVRKLVADGFVFLTTTDVVQPFNTNLDTLSMAQLDLSGVCDRYIPKLYCVKSTGRTSQGDNMIEAASYFDIDNAAFAVTSENMNPGEVKQLITQGFVQDMSFNWSFPPQTGLFVGGAGEITPHTNTEYSIQKIGHIVNANTIYINIGRHIILS
jgi:hypothetical protein